MNSLQDAQLLRGKACTSCRRRKMRCDGGRPYCGQCIKGHRTDDCEYTDNQGRTRTQVLEENIALLQARVQELEDPNIAARRVFLRDPYEAFRQSERRARMLTVIATEQASGTPSGERLNAEELNQDITETLIQNFIPRSGALGFVLNMNNFINTAQHPPQHPDKPHACLLYAVYLHGARLSNEATIHQMEEEFLERAILSLQDAIRETNPNAAPAGIDARHRMEAIQAEILIAVYFYTLGYVVEGRHHSAAASTLSISCGLHRIPKFADPHSPKPSSLKARLGFDLNLNLKRRRGTNASMDLAPPKDANEHTERINLFWTVFACDRVWGSAMGAPNLFVDSSSSGTRIDTPFPTAEGELQYDRTVQRFLAGEPGSLPSANENKTGLRARAAALFERANRISAQSLEESSPEKRARLREESRVIARVITSFARRLPPVETLEVSATQKVEDSDSIVYLTSHALAHSAMFALHGVGVAGGELTAINASLTHATEVVKIIEKCCRTDTQHTTACPILAMLGELAAQIFLVEAERLMRLSPLGDINELSQALQSRIGAVRSNVQRIVDAFRLVDSWISPIFGEKAEAIEDALNEA